MSTIKVITKKPDELPFMLAYETYDDSKVNFIAHITLSDDCIGLMKCADELIDDNVTDRVYICAILEFKTAEVCDEPD